MSGAHFMDLSKPVSARLFAKMVGVGSDNAVRKAVARQSIIKGYDATTKKLIPEIAAREWGKEILPEFLAPATKPVSAVSSLPAKKVKPKPSTSKDISDSVLDNAAAVLKEAMAEKLPHVNIEDVGNVEDDEPEDDTLNEGADRELGGKVAKTEAERVSAIFKAKILQLAYKEKRGQMVPIAKVNTVLFSYGQEIRTAVEGIPNRVIDKIRATDTRHEALRILEEEVYNTLILLADIQDRKFE